MTSSSGDPLRLTPAGGHGLLPSQTTAGGEVLSALAPGRRTVAALAAAGGYAQAEVPRQAPGVARLDAARSLTSWQDICYNRISKK